MIDEDSSSEGCDSSPPELTKVPRAPPERQTRRSMTPDDHSVTERVDSASVLVTTKGAMSALVAPPVGSALRKNADGSIAAPKVLPKRNKDSKVKVTLFYLITG